MVNLWFWVLTHSVVPEWTDTSVWSCCSFGTSGGPQVEVMEEETHTKPFLQDTTMQIYKSKNDFVFFLAKMK